MIIQAIAYDITTKYVPPHVNIYCCLRGITPTCFTVKVTIWIVMTCYYHVMVTKAFSRENAIYSNSQVHNNSIVHMPSCNSSYSTVNMPSKTI